MAEEPGFFSYENFPYPLLALGQTIPRGYQYQSQMTPYRRDARGDWGRALNESIDQFFGMWPQFMQQRRQFTLQRDQLARQRLADKHQAKLRPLELKQLQAEQQIRDNRMQVLKNYPTMVANLPVSDKQKAFLKTLPPNEGLKMMQAIMTQRLKPRTQFIKAGQPDSRGVVRRLDVQEKSDGTIIKAAVSPQKITVPPGGLFPGTKDKNTTGVHVEYDPSSGSLSYPLDKPHTEVITLAVGDVGNPYNVPLAFNPKTKEYSFPLERPHIELKTVQPGEEFPDGTTNNTPRPIQYDKKTNKRFTYEGTAAQKKIVSLGKFDKRRDDFPKHQQNFLKLDMTQGGDGVVILDPAASSMAEELITVPPGGLYPDGKTVNNLKTPVQVSRSGKLSAPLGTTIPEEFVPVLPNDPRLDAYPQPLHQYLHINKKNNNISFHPSFTREMQQLVLKEARPSATQRFQKWLKVPGNQVRSYADLEPWTGTSQESKYWFATQNLPADNPLHIDAQNQLNLKHVKVTPNAIIIGRGYKDPSKPDEAKRLPEPTTEKILTGDTVSSLAKRFGTTESQIIAANPDWFNKDMNGKADLKSMRTSEQMEDAEMIIPTGKSNLSPGQINDAHSSRRRARVTEMPYGTIIPIQTATVGDGLRLNTERLDMQNIQKSVKDFVELMQNPKARGFGKIGKKEKGELEGIRQRLINNVQVLRDYGVLSPSEITNIERSVPPVNSIIALMTRGLGSDQFVVGAMNKLYEEAVNRQRQLESLIKLYGAPITDYERFSGGVPGINTGQQENIFQEQDSLEYVEQ